MAGAKKRVMCHKAVAWTLEIALQLLKARWNSMRNYWSDLYRFNANIMDWDNPSPQCLQIILFADNSFWRFKRITLQRLDYLWSPWVQSKIQIRAYKHMKLQSCTNYWKSDRLNYMCWKRQTAEDESKFEKGGKQQKMKVKWFKYQECYEWLQNQKPWTWKKRMHFNK